MSVNKQSLVLSMFFCLGLLSCRPDVTCPNPKKDANKLFSNASKGKSTQKEKTSNGLIKKKNPNQKKKK